MSSDFNPGKYEQPDHIKEEVKSARTGFGLLLLGCFTLGQSVQAFSRVPGTSGPFFVIAQLFCIFVQVWYYQAFAESLGQHDLVGITVPLLIQLIWFVVTVVAAFRWRLRGVEFELTQPGIGILHRWMPNQNLPKTNFVSDLLVAVLLTTALFLLQSPILGRWYLMVAVSLTFTHLWMDWRERTELRRIQYAQRRAQQWSSKLSQTHRR